LAGKPPRAISSAAMLLHLYRGIRSSLIARCRTSSREPVGRPETSRRFARG
jgi:hypothetical protein